MQGMASKGEKTRADIVDSARKLFYERGYDSASFSHIVDATGLFRGNIYHYFKTKDEILEAVVDSYLNDYQALLTQWEREHNDPKARLRAFVDMIAGHKAALVKYGCPIGSLNTELGKERRELQHVARALFELFQRWLAVRFSELGYGKEADSLALHLLGRAQGIAVISHVYQDKQFLERETGQLADWIEQL
jgi:AcrR family transcriptional regulator